MFYNIALRIIYGFSWIELQLKRLFSGTNHIIRVKDSIEYKCSGLNYDFMIATKGNLYSINQFEESQGRFIFTELLTNGEKIKINFKTDNYNYYLSGNKLDRKFMVYFMKKYYSRSIDVYTVSFIDNNVKNGEFNQSQSVVFSQDGYTIS